MVVVGGGGETPIIPPHDQLAGITSTSDQYPDTARGIHLTAADADKLKTLLTAILNVISSTDTETVATDTNVFTALRTLIEIADRAISKTADDTAAGMIGFDKGIKSTNYDPLSPLGPGMSLKAVMDDNGNPTGFWELIIDYLTVNAKATFKEVVIEQILHVGGAFLFSRASMECIKMDTILDTDGVTVKAYRCYMDENKINRWDVGCMALCQQFILPTTRRYWRAVIAVGDHWIDLSPTVCEFGSDIPMEKDAIIQFGHLTDPASRSAILLTSYGEDGPSITFYKNIGAVFAGETHPFNLTGRAKTHLGATKSRFVGELVVEGEDGVEYRVPADRGDWTPGAYYYYDRVRYGNAQWLCVAIPSTTLEPSDANSSVWKKELSSGNGTPGNYPSHVFKESLEQPATPTGTSPIPAGWLDGPTGLGTWWMSKATVNGATGLAGAWSVPIQVSGANGTKTPFRFAKNTSLEVYPAIDVDNINPGEVWLVDPPELVDGEYLWMTKAEIRTMAQNAEGNVFDDIFSDEFWGAAALERIDQLVANWSVPVRISGEKGTDGKDGKDYEFIYTRTATSASPDTPETSQTDDYVPAGWTDNQVGVDSVNKFEWVSKRVKINGIWGAFSVPAISANWSSDGEDGDPGADALEASLSNSQHNIPSDSDGNDCNYSGAVCTMYIYKGVVDDSANWTVTITKSVGVSGTQNGKTYTITGLSTDNGYVDFTASRSGYPSILKRMTLTKTKSGEPGVTPTAYWLVTPPSVARAAKGTYMPTAFSVLSYSSISTTPTLYSGKITIWESEDGVSYTAKYNSTANESSKTYTPSSATVKSFMVQLRKSITDSTVLDQQIIPVVNDGTPGTPGTDGISYLLSANATIITKIIAMATTTYTPSTLSFYPRKRVGGATPIAPADCNMKIQGFNGTSWVDLQTVASVTSLTYNQTVSATYSQYRAQLYLSTVLVQELVIFMVEDAKSAKDALSYLIGGFNSYTDHVAFASTYGKILMAGGYINASLIDVESLVTDALLVQKMANIAGTYFQTDGVTFTQKNGITLPAVINSVATSLDINPQSLPDISAFLTDSALTGTTNLPAIISPISDRQTLTSPVAQATNGYMSIPSGVTSIKNNSISISGSVSIDNRNSGDRTGFTYVCAMFALFYNGTTLVSRVLLGQYLLDQANDYGGINYSLPSATLAVPSGATRIYLHSEHTLYVRTNDDDSPSGELNFNAVASSAYFYNATGVYKSRISPDGYALARDSSNYFHVKADATKVTLNYQGDVISNSIQQKLISCVFEANGTPRAYGGYGTRSSFTMNRVSTGVYRVVHNMNTSLGLNSNNYNIQVTSEVGLVWWHIWPVSNNEFQIKVFNTSGVPADTILHVSVTRI